MFKKLTLAAVTGLGLFATSAVEAAPVAVHAGLGYAPVAHRPYRHRAHHRHYHYRVLYRTCARDPWAYHAGFRTRWEADRAAVILRNRGLEVFIR